MRPNMAALLPNMATRPSPSPRRDAAACKSEAAEGGVAIFGKSGRNMAILGRSLRTASGGGAVSEPPLLLPAGKERGPAARPFDPSPFRPLGGGQIRQHSSFQRRQEIGQEHSSFATPLLAHLLASYTHAVGSPILYYVVAQCSLSVAMCGFVRVAQCVVSVHIYYLIRYYILRSTVPYTVVIRPARRVYDPSYPTPRPGSLRTRPSAPNEIGVTTKYPNPTAGHAPHKAVPKTAFHPTWPPELPSRALLTP